MDEVNFISRVLSRNTNTVPVRSLARTTLPNNEELVPLLLCLATEVSEQPRYDPSSATGSKIWMVRHPKYKFVKSGPGVITLKKKYKQCVICFENITENQVAM